MPTFRVSKSLKLRGDEKLKYCVVETQSQQSAQRQVGFDMEPKRSEDTSFRSFETVRTIQLWHLTCCFFNRDAGN